MTEFHVEYRIEVDADDAESAARKVAAMLAAGGAARGVYHVRPHPNRYTMHPEADDTEIDLGEIDGTWTDAPDVDGNQSTGTLVWHVLSGPDSEGGMWLQQGTKTDDGKTPAGFNLVAYERPDKSCVDFITAASAREAEAIYRAWLDREGIVIPDEA